MPTIKHSPSTKHPPTPRLRRTGQAPSTLLAFTLVELSVVLVVIALITGMGIAGGMAALESTKRAATETKMNVIEDSLATFRIKYGRLPCPTNAINPTTDANYGLEATNNSGTCYTGGSAAISATYLTTTGVTGVPSGAVPTRTLGLPDEFMYDGWGKKFRYEVTPAMTRDNAFLYSQVFDSCAITVNHHEGTALGTNAVYTLVSHGKNGIGAYLAGGTQFTDGTAGTAEQTNIRGASYTTSPTIRIKNGTSGTMGTAGYYDDMVRFKQRYQLMDAIDRSTAVYKGPEMIVTHDDTSSTAPNVQLVYGKATCNFWQPLAVTIPALPAATPRFIAFTPNNRNLVAYLEVGGVGYCKLYNISNTTFTALTDFTNCPTAATKGAMAKDSGTLALNDTGGNGITIPYIRIYTLTGTGAAAVYTEVSNALSPALTYAPDNITLSANGEYLTVSKSTGSTPVLYTKNADGSYNQTSAMPTGSVATDRSTAISPDGKYYALTEISGVNIDVYVYRNINGVFSNIGASPTYTTTALGLPVLSFSPDSHYLAIGGTVIFTGKLTMVYINPVTEAVTEALNVATAGNVKSIAFSKDSTFVTAALGGIGTNSISVYRRNNATAFNSTAETISSAFVFNTEAGKLSNHVAMSR